MEFSFAIENDKEIINFLDVNIKRLDNYWNLE